MAALVLGAVVLFLRDDGNVPIQVALPTPGLEESGVLGAAAVGSELRVYVSGAVRHPGVYTLGPDDRLDDALAAAGGPTGDAQLGAMNLAARVQDEGHYHFPGIQDTQLAGPTPAPDVTLGSSPNAVTPCGGLIDLNSAAAGLLETLPLIGEVRAAAIVSFREQTGPFQSVEEITSVSGIGPATYEAVRDLVAVCG